MESLLAKRFRETVAKSKDYRMKNEAEFDVGYPTGFVNFDFRNGTIVRVHMDNKTYSYFSIGIVDGSMNTIIGRSGSGKTTWCVQSACNIIRPFKTSCLYIDSIEGGITKTRLEVLSRFNPTEIDERIIERNTGITAENFFERIRLIYQLKMDKRADYEYNTGFLDNYGNPIIKLEPTVYILDSFAMLMPETYANEEELSGQMSATSTAKTNTAIMKRIIPMLKSANIILFIINHITQKVEANPFSHSKSQLAYLKQGERLPGGEASVFLANNIIRFDDASKLKSDEGFGIDGSITELSLVKSRTNKAGKFVSLVFNQNTGFDTDLSLFLMLKEEGKINGGGSSFYIADRNDIKFSQKTFKDKLMEIPELREVFISESINCLKSVLTEDMKFINKYNCTINDDILKKINEPIEE